MQKHLIILFLLLLMAAEAVAVTQRGMVRTIARPDSKSEPLAGVVVRVRGSHNAIESQADGGFSIPLASLNNGDAFVISTVMLSGYELADKELIGRRIACSETVPIEILMVNREALQREKDRIAEKARQNVEVYYEKRVAEFEQQLQQGRIKQEEYRQQLDDLEQKYEQFEPLLELMADKFARTDISMLSDIDLQINAAIEAGNLDEAERLIHSKGDFSEREQQLADANAKNTAARAQLEAMQKQLEEAEKATRQQLNSLQNDYYNLYTIHLSRFRHDSAAHYLCLRAELDTTNAVIQTETGQFIENIIADYPKALAYFRRAERHAADNTLQQTIIYHDMAETYQYLEQYDKAEHYYQRALDIIRKTRAKDYPEEVAETLNNLADLYRETQNYKQALDCQQEVLKIWKKHYGDKHIRVAIATNNLGMIYLDQQKLKPAKEQFLAAIEIAEALPDKENKDLASFYNNIATVYYYERSFDLSEEYFQKAYDLFLKVLGADHPQTKNTQTNLQVLKQVKGN